MQKFGDDRYLFVGYLETRPVSDEGFRNSKAESDVEMVQLS